MVKKNTSDTDKALARSILGVHRSYEHENYLGLPLLMGISKMNEFFYMVGRVRAKVQGWNVRLLSQAGREVLIKFVA